MGNHNNDALTEALAKIKALEAERDALKKASTGKLVMKVSAKGGASLYGMGRWPVTLYASQWRRLLAFSEGIAAFLEAHKGELVEKDGTVAGETRMPSGAIVGEPESAPVEQ